jgi:hypothetical protein
LTTAREAVAQQSGALQVGVLVPGAGFDLERGDPAVPGLQDEVALVAGISAEV